MKNGYVKFIIIMLTGLIMAHGATQALAAGTAADFYKGNTITILINANPGTSNDIYARTMAPYLSEFTGAKVVVENKPAGGGLQAVNDMYKNAKPDGLLMLLGSTGKLWLGWALNQKNVYFDASKFEYLPGIAGGPYVMNVSPTGKYNTIEAFKKGTGLRMPCSNKTSIMALAGMAASEIFNLKDAVTIQGWKTAERFIAVKQGEAEATVASLDTSLKKQQAGQTMPLFQIRSDRHEKAPDLPSIAELATLSDYHKKLLSVLFTEGKVFMAPPGVPEDKLKFLEDAITKVLSIKEVQQKIEKNAGIWYGIYTVADVNEAITGLAANKANLNLYLKLMDKYVK